MDTIILGFIQAVQASLTNQPISSLWDQWIEELYPCFEQSPQSNEKAWLEGLSHACTVALAVIRSKSNTSPAFDDGKVLLSYQLALHVVFQQAKGMLDADNS